MKCSLCRQIGHNKRTCDFKFLTKNNMLFVSTRNEVQSHGFSQEKQIISNIYNVTNDEIKQIKYNDKIDLPAKFNRFNNCDVSIKTTCNQNTVCMANCLSVFDAINSEKLIHMIVVCYKQENACEKNLSSIIEIDLTNSRQLLFGTLTHEQIEML